MSKDQYRSRSWLGLLAALFLTSFAQAQVEGLCGPLCGHEKCPPPYKHRYEGAPRIRYKRACPRPVCDPCHLPHYGYFQPCWRKWPWTPDWSHCPCPPPGALVPAAQGRQPVLPEPEGDRKDNNQTDEDAPRPRPVTRYLPPQPVGQTPTKTTKVARGNEVKVPALPPKEPRSLLPRKEETKTVAAALPTKETTVQKASLTKIMPSVKVVGSRTVILNVAKEILGEIIPGRTRVELWYTQDGRQWYRDETVAEKGPPFEVEVQQDGTYGFTVRAQNATGRQQPPPRRGDAPQLWVEVDTQKPQVSLMGVKPIMSHYSRAIAIKWTASDRNLSSQPISIAWSVSPQGPWSAVMTNLDNTGETVWQLPENIPPRIHLRVEAHDTAGNVGTAQTMSSLIIPTVSAARE